MQVKIIMTDKSTAKLNNITNYSDIIWFTKNDCMPCKRSSHIVKALTDLNWTVSKVEKEVDPDLVEASGVSVFPSFKIVKSNELLQGSQSLEDLLAHLRN